MRMKRDYIYDMHCHLYKFDDSEINEILRKDKELMIVAVSDDLNSLKRTLEIYQQYPERVIVCAGFHPWNVGKVPLAEINEILRIVYRRDIVCLGEVGLDRKFVPKTINDQYMVFRKFLEASKELGVMLNIHAPNAWKEALDLLQKYDIEKAMFHWYTGPIDLIDVIGELGYRISINPAIEIQKKHQNVAKKASLRYIVLESDGPYEYRGLRLTPLMVREAAREVAKIKNVGLDEVLEKALANSLYLLHRL